MPSAAASSRLTPLTVFAALWAAAMIFHQSKWSYWLVSPREFVFSLAAFWLLLRPSSLARFATLVVVHLWHTMVQLPHVSNHWMTAAFANLAIAVALGRALVKTRGVEAPAERLFAEFAAPVRISVLLLYAFSSFHKLNVDWLDAEVSCAPLVYGQLAGKLPILPVAPWTDVVAIYAPIVVESAIPLLLLVPGLRLAGLMLASVFHYLLGIGTFFNFSAIMYALLFLFAPANFTDLLDQRWRSSSIARRLGPLIEPPVRDRVVRLLTVALGLLAAAVFALQPWSNFSESSIIVRDVTSGTRPTFSYLFEAAWWLYAPVLACILVLALRSGRPLWHDLGSLLRVRSPALALVPLLVAANGLSPYVGLKTETSFSMFSNLRTEGATTNHLIVRRPLALAGYQRDLVTVLDSSDAELRKVADRGYQLTYFELRSYVSDAASRGVSGLRLRYVRGGSEHSLENAERDPELSSPPSTLLRKLLAFRPVRPADRNTCQH